MQDLDYIQAMSKIQDKFKSMLQELDLENPEVMQMLENIDYTADNPFKFVEDGEKISRKIISTQRENKTNLISIDGNYKVHVGKNGIKDNLYSTLFALLGNRKYNLLYEKFQDNDGRNSKENILLKFHKQIEEATTDEDFITKPYDNLYYSYHHKNFKRQRFLLSHLKNKNDGDIHFRNFYGARKKYNNLTEVLCK
jgi:uncharacterized protein (DUF1919 family)